MTESSVPNAARVVVIGGGVIGCSVAYHLAKLGWSDVLLLEREQLTSGTTWHAAGLLTSLRDTETQTRLAAYSQNLYRDLEEETGQATGLIKCGSIQLALTPAKTEEMRRGIQAAQCFGIDCHEIGVSDVKQAWPLAYVEDVQAAFLFPNDGRINPTDLTQALAKGARRRGARIIEHCVVTGIEQMHGQVTGVITDAGRIETKYVVNCAGMWARAVGKLANVNVPLQAAEHYYLISEPVAGVHPLLPVLRDPGRSTYIREEAGKIMVGLFETEAKPWAVGGVPADFTFGEIPPDWEHMHPHLERAMQRVPILADTGIKLLFCGPESFTPDHNYLMGQAPGLDGFYVAAGFNSLGIVSGGGAGFVMAHWIVHGHAPMDVWSVDIRRMHPWQDNSKYLADRVVESLGISYQDHFPFRQWKTARGIKRGILHDRLAAAGAGFGESAGWERANWYAKIGERAEYEYSWGRQNWFACSAEEHRAVRERVGLFDQSSFAKFMIQGADAERALNRIATSDCRVAVGKVIYTQLLNERGGIEADVTLIRLAADQFLLVTAAFAATHVISWITQHIDPEAACVVIDVSEAWSVLNVQGPQSRELLSQVSTENWSDGAFPFGTARRVLIGYQQAVAVRISYVGELGWELYVPTSFTLGVYEALANAGAGLGLKHCGYHALNSLRIEKGFREWGHDIGSHDTPIEAGLSFTCAWEKPGGFIGKEALVERRGQSPQRRLVQFLLQEADIMLYHNEPILVNGKRCGFITSGMYGHTLGGAVGLGYVNDPAGVSLESIEASRFEIVVADRRVSAKASLRAMYDPLRTRLHGA